MDYHNATYIIMLLILSFSEEIARRFKVNRISLIYDQNRLVIKGRVKFKFR